MGTTLAIATHQAPQLSQLRPRHPGLERADQRLLRLSSMSLRLCDRHAQRSRGACHRVSTTALARCPCRRLRLDTPSAWSARSSAPLAHLVQDPLARVEVAVAVEMDAMVDCWRQQSETYVLRTRDALADGRIGHGVKALGLRNDEGDLEVRSVDELRRLRLYRDALPHTAALASPGFDGNGPRVRIQNSDRFEPSPSSRSSSLFIALMSSGGSEPDLVEPV